MARNLRWWMMPALGLGLALSSGACAQRDHASTAPTPVTTVMPAHVTLTVTAPVVPMPTVTEDVRAQASATVTAEATTMLPTPTPGLLYFTSKRGGYQLQLPVPWREHAPDLVKGEPAATVELGALRDGADATAAMTAALIEAHGLTLEQWRDAVASTLVLEGFDLKDVVLVEAGGAARIPVARITYQLPGADEQTQMGMQLAWFAPDDQIVVVTFATDAAGYGALVADVDQMLQTLALTGEAATAASKD